MSQMELIEAIKSGNRASVEELIAGGAELNQQDKQGWTPLNWAAGSGQLEIVELLLERGADPLAVGRDLRTPQMIALAAGHAEVVKRLRRAEAEAKGGEATPSDRKYCTAFHVGDLRRYAAWTETQPLADDDVVFLHQDYTVTKSIWTGEDVIFDNVTDQWKDFCSTELRFAVPDGLDLIAKPAQTAQSAA
ncbi:MAG: ankyrin repeat domain-containing protein [Acidobacteria bacterium]|nr:ankyrin repeat domain-containing protein [Acidobacteriota bacterium]